ncbi:MAG: DUF308 domain-containing protein [Thermoplasmata archaeon]
MQASTVRLPSWYRALTAVVGLISIALAFVLLAYPGIALLTLVFLLAFALLVIGIDRLIAGITGHPFGWMPGAGGGWMGGPMSGKPSDSNQTPPPHP